MQPDNIYFYFHQIRVRTHGHLCCRNVLTRTKSVNFNQIWHSIHEIHGARGNSRRTVSTGISNNT